MDYRQLSELIRKYNSGRCNAEEKQFLEQWYLSQEWDAASGMPDGDEIKTLRDQYWMRLQQAGQLDEPLVRRMLPPKPWVRYAAAAVLAIAGAAYFLTRRSSEKMTVSAELAALPAPPANGVTRAILRIGSGKTVALGGYGHFMRDDVPLLDSAGMLSYLPSIHPTHQSEHLLTTPNGSVYQVLLSDGSRVWLNAASSLRYPAHFQGAERSVTLTGEAYFEIAPDPAKPFRVLAANGNEVQVLGTRFNMNTYPDEHALRTTLLDGAVKVKSTHGEFLLSPGQQAVVAPNGEISRTSADLEAVMAWRNGLFVYRKTGIRQIMQQLARWYNVDVRYEGDVPNREFTGEISRELSLPLVLKILEQQDLHFRLEGGAVIVQH